MFVYGWSISRLRFWTWLFILIIFSSNGIFRSQSRGQHSTFSSVNLVVPPRNEKWIHKITLVGFSFKKKINLKRKTEILIFEAGKSSATNFLVQEPWSNFEIGGGGVHNYWGGTRYFFLLNLYNFKNMGGRGGHVPPCPPPPPPILLRGPCSAPIYPST